MAARGAALLGLALLLGACGFQLRGYDLGAGIDSAFVAASPRHPLDVPLRRALEQAGVRMAARADDADVVVSLLDARRERRSASVSAQARATEYETTLGVRFRVTDGQGNELVPDQWLERDRVFRVDRDNLVGSSEEQALLEQEMQQDLVQQMLRAIDAAVAARHAA